MGLSKKWYQSKTVWANLIAAAAIIVQTQVGFVIDEEAQTGLIIVINLILRAITSEGLTA